MNWFTWYLFEDEVNSYFWRMGAFLLVMFIISGVPPMGTLLWWVVWIDIIYWFFQKKPRLRAMNDD